MQVKTDEKYGVCPLDDGEIGDALEPGTYFVIRSQDVFGAAALFGYAHLIQSALEVDRLRPRFTPEERAALEEQVTNVLVRAEDWQRRGDAKLPD